MKEIEFVVVDKVEFLQMKRKLSESANFSKDDSLNGVRKNQKETAKWIGITEPTIIRWKKLGLIPFEQIPGTSKVWFNLSEVKLALQQKRNFK